MHVPKNIKIWEKILRKGFGEGNYWNLVEINADIVLRLKTRKTMIIKVNS